MNELSVIGLVRKNSKDYVHEVFNAFKNNQIVVPIKSKNEIPQNSSLRFENIIEPLSNWGWINDEQKIIKTHIEQVALFFSLIIEKNFFSAHICSKTELFLTKNDHIH